MYGDLPAGIGPGIFELPIPVTEIAKLHRNHGDILVIRYAKDRQPSNSAVSALKTALDEAGMKGTLLLIPDDWDLKNVDTLSESDGKSLYRVLQTRFEP